MIYWLVRFVNNFRQYIILAILILFSLLLLSLNDSKEIRNLRKVSFIFYGLIDYAKSPFDEFIFYKSENEKLRRENAELLRELLILKMYEKERSELYELLKFEELNPAGFIVARIVLKSNDINSHKFVLDKGKKDGVKLNSIVFNSKGLIGYISELVDSYSIVHTISNFNVRISVKSLRNDASGILSWDGEKFKVYNVSKSADVKEGDVFATSEYSSQFPAGIPVIKVTYASKETDILFYDISGISISDLNNIKYCFIQEPDLNIKKINFLINQ